MEATEQPRDVADSVFVLTTSRSGSTLLRFLLEAHPLVACPPETQLGSACSGLAHTLAVLEGLQAGLKSGPPDVSRLSDVGKAAIRDVITQAFATYADSVGGRIWCDKSLDTYWCSGLLIELFPQARFIILTRDCFDVIASGLAADPWSLQLYGFGQYAQAYPGNHVAAIAAYWERCTRLNLAFAQAHPQNCVKIRYEDLVRAPDEVMTEVFRHLGLTKPGALVDGAFNMPHTQGYGDHTIWFTDHVHTDSVGRGRAVPRQLVPRALVPRIDELLRSLGYDASGVAPSNARLPAARRRPGTTVAGVSSAPRLRDRQAADVMAAIDERVRAASVPTVLAAFYNLGLRTGITVSFTSSWDEEAGRRAHYATSWRVTDAGLEPVAGSDGAPACDQLSDTVVLDASPPVWQAVLDGDSNLFVSTRDGSVVWRDAERLGRPPADATYAVSVLLGLAAVPLRRSRAGTDKTFGLRENRRLLDQADT